MKRNTLGALHKVSTFIFVTILQIGCLYPFVTESRSDFRRVLPIEEGLSLSHDTILILTFLPKKQDRNPYFMKEEAEVREAKQLSKFRSRATVSFPFCW